MTSDRRIRRRRLRLAVIAAAVLNALPPALLANDLPTPCAGGACGIAPGATPFVTSGEIGHGGLPAVNGTTMTIQQLSDKAILNWQNFNIGAGHEVVFQQPSATAAALNRIWSADPSVIAGRLTANGQVFLLNQNGIVFDRGAQVNVSALVAATLNLKDSVFLNGILSANGGYNGVGLPPVFEAGSGAVGDVTVKPGAVLTTERGGRVLLFAPRVVNEGTISTPDGQTILGAGKTVYLAASSDPGMRGLLIQVDGGNVPEQSTVTNGGDITAARGNVTLAGLMVNQNGRVRATTSVGANGSVYLVAGDTSRPDPQNSSTKLQFFNANAPGFGRLSPNRGGTLTLGSGSVTEVLPDTTDTGTITDGQAFLRSSVQLVGQTITLQDRASILAPSGEVTLSAAENPIERQLNPGLAIGAPANASRIYLDAGSRIDVSGVGSLTNAAGFTNAVALSAERNLIQVELRANELQDAPLLRNGFLRGRTITVDLREGTTLADLAPYRANIARGILEKSTAGGDIRVLSEGDVITRAGSVLDVSGGRIAYAAGYGRTTQLLGADGRLYDVATAPLDMQYVSFADSYSYTDPKWGATTTWSLAGGTRGRPLPGYLEGAAAGSVAIVAPQAALRGTLAAQTVNGLYQRTAATLPAAGRFVLGDAAGLLANGALKDLRSPSIRIARTVDDLAEDFTATSPLTAADRATVVLASDTLVQGGFGHVALYGNGSITVDTDVALRLSSGGSFTAVGQAIAIGGAIDVPAGSIALATRVDLLGSATISNDIVLGNAASLVTRGVWVNDSPAYTRATGRAPTLTAPVLVDGGDIALRAAGGVRLGPGSLVDASGGAWLDAADRVHRGTGGDITLTANVDAIPSRIVNGVTLGGTIRSASLATGGTLTVGSAFVTVGPAASGATGELRLDPAFFSQGGFSDYRITGQNGVVISDGVQVRPRTQTLLFSRGTQFEATGADLFAFTNLVTLPDEFRSPTSVHFAATSTRLTSPTAGDVILGNGASIVVDPGAAVGLSARVNLTVLGSIVAPAGQITLETAPDITVGNDDRLEGYVADQRLLVGSNARLWAQGFADIDTLNLLGYRRGEVLAGGTVAILANKGSVVIESGAVVDVSGTSAIVDIETPGTGTGRVTPTLVAGAAGSIEIRAREGMSLAGTLAGRAAPLAGAAGGSLTIGFDLYDRSVNPNAEIPPGSSVPRFPTGTRTLIVAGAGTAPAGSAQNGLARIDTTTISGGGFDAVSLSSTDVIRLSGDVAIAANRSITVDAPAVIADIGSSASLSAAYVALGNANPGNQPGTASGQQIRNPVAGDATFTVHADLIDWRGNGTLSGFSDVRFASTGDLRLTHARGGNGSTDFTGSIRTTADLVLEADRVYPTTLTSFTVNPGGGSTTYTPGTVTLLPGDTTGGVPLSAGGHLTINASTIDQRGVLRAPFGEIVLNATERVTLAAGSLTSVSAEGRIIPFGSTQNGRDWIYRVDDSGKTIVLAAPPAGEVTLNAPAVTLAGGARLDLSGSGDLYAYEFVAGPGGSRDVLDPTAAGAYTAAIVPWLDSAYAPLDHQYGLGTDLAPGQGIYLSGVPGLPAGFYALLPARYALLPGAYGVRALAGHTDMPVGSPVALPGGSVIVAGREGYAGTDLVASRTAGYLVAPGSVVRSQSGYIDSTANPFFAQAGSVARLPADAGQLTLAASTALVLGGSIGFDHSQFTYQESGTGKIVARNGRGGTVAVIAPLIAVVDTPGGATDGFLQIGAADLNALGAESLILGARRTTAADGDVLTVGASAVEVRNSTAHALSAPEIVLAATGRIETYAGSALDATGGGGRDGAALRVQGDGALLRLAAGPQATLTRSSIPSNAVGSIVIGADTSLAGASLLLDAAADTRIASSTHLDVHALSVAASRINVGAAPLDAPGLNLRDDLLAGLAGLTELALRSYGTIDLYGAVALGGTGSDGTPALTTLTLDATALRGFGAGQKTLTGATVAFENRSGGSCTSAACAADGTGALQIVGGSSAAGAIRLGSGDKTVAGFGAVALTTGGAVSGAGTGSLTLIGAGDLTLTVSRVTTSSGADQQILNRDGSVLIAAPAGTVADVAAADLGGRLAITATAVEHRGRIDLPAGILSLRATAGDVVLANGSRIGAAGATRTFAGTNAYADGGRITLASNNGSVFVRSGATIDIAGANDGTDGGNAGALTVLAVNGGVTLAGALLGQAVAGRRSADFALDVRAADNLSALTAALATGHLNGDVAIRVRTGDVTLGSGSTIRASHFALAADGGALHIEGGIDTGGIEGGDIALWANGNVTLASGAALLASGSAAGGDVFIGTTTGRIALQAGATLDLRGTGAESEAGVLTLRAPRTTDNVDVRIDAIAATIRGDRAVIIEGVRVYDLAGSNATIGGSGTLAQGNLDLSVPDATGNSGGALYADTRAFGNAATGIANRIGGTGTAVQVRPGVEVRSTGNLKLAGALDLRAAPVTVLTDEDGMPTGIEKGADSWRVGDVPINLTLRAGGNLTIDASLSDGFLTPSSGLVNRLTLAGGDSASLRLVAGADLTAADPTAIRTGTPTGTDLILTPGHLIRTGNGRIDLAAAGDVKLGFDPVTASYTRPNAQASVVYTAGTPSATLAGFPPPTDRFGDALALVPEFPTGGGDIAIRAGRDVVAAPSNQFTSDWLWRGGVIRPDGTIGSNSLGVAQNPAWWIAFDRFQQGVGALGGGNVRVSAGRDVTNVSVAIPTTGRLPGAIGSVPTANDLVVTGGGNLDVIAGRDIASGVFQVDRGNARLEAGGAVTSGRVVAATNPVSGDQRAVYPVLLLADGSIEIAGRTGVTIQSALNSTALPVAVSAREVIDAAFFYTYATDARVALMSSAGDVRLLNDAQVLKATQPVGQVDTFASDLNLLVYPPNLSAAALTGSITVGNTRLFASSEGSLELLATRDVRFSGPLQMYEFDVARSPAPLRPVLSLAGTGGVSAIPGRIPEIYLDTVPLPVPTQSQSLPLAGSEPVRIVATTGSIQGAGQQILLPKPAWFSAGLDITDLRFSGKNLLDTDVTRIEAGRDISFRIAKDAGSNGLVANNDGIRVGGPGHVLVRAAGDIDLGNSRGVVTRGNLDDVRLPSGGATLVVGAGFGRSVDGTVQQPALAAFVDRYLAGSVGGTAPARLYGTDLTRYMRDRNGNSALTDTEALALFRALPADAQLPFVAGVLYRELYETGIDHNTRGTSYDRGYTAIATLFPGNNYRGELNLFFSQLKTEQGGDIQLLVPGGTVTVGLASPPAELNVLKRDVTVNPAVPAAANLGILVTASGAVRGFAKGDFAVNQARILTLQGGDILLWSSDGNIDAGRGAKTASAAPPPVIQTDANGNVFVNPSGAVSGSGIGQLLTVVGIDPGSVSLIAPRGEVNAGDAGIRVAGDLNIAALRVIGADNIRVGGASTGVPVNNTGSLSGALSGASNVTDASKNTLEQMNKSLNSAVAESKALSDSFKPSFLTVKLLCLGAECTPTITKN